MGARQRKSTKMAAQSPKQQQNGKVKKDIPSSDFVAILKRRERLDSPLAIITSILMGLVFGFALNKGRVAEPTVIVDQFRFTRWIMMKMFLSAAGTSCLTLSILSFLFYENWLIARSKFKTCFNLAGTIIGGILLGSGMAIGGACPGMVLIQVGCGVPNSIITVIGALSGAFIYGLTEPFFRNYFNYNTMPTKNNKTFLDEILNINYSILTFIIGMLLMLFTLYLDILFPWQSELTTESQRLHVISCNNNNNNLHGFFTCRSWNPIIAGIFVGLLQIPAVIILGQTIGGSSAYVAIMGQWLRIMPQNINNYFKHFSGKLNYWWQVVYVLSAIFGSTFAVYIGGGNVNTLLYEPFDGITGNTKEKAFIGGFLMVFGARLAGGCTSGHGLSGMGLLSFASMIAVASMFAGGGIVGLTMQSMNL